MAVGYSNAVVDAPIVPGQSLGGFELRTHLRDLDPVLDTVHLKNLGNSDWYKLVNQYEARYTVGPVEIGVHVFNGKVFKLIASKGYEGRLLDRLYIGLNAGEAMKIEPRLYHDEAEGALYVRDCPGVVLELPVDDPFPHEVPEYPISAITVFVPEVWTSEGLNGNW